MQDNKPQLIAVIVLCLVAGFIVAPADKVPKWPDFLKTAKIEPGIDIAGGAELTYRVLFPASFKGDKKAECQKVTDVLENRFRAKQGVLQEPRFTVRGEDQVTLQMPGIDRDRLEDYKRLVTTIGRLELKEVASKEIHEQYNASGQVPAGFEAYRTERQEPERYPWIKDYTIVHQESVITGEDIAHAQPEVNPESVMSGAPSYVIHFELKPDGARKFDLAADRLYKQEPKGKIAIIIDHTLKAAPAVQTDRFNGKGQITGNYDHDGASELAFILKSGSLPFGIGRLAPGGKQIDKEPEEENFVGPSLGQDSIQRGIWASLISALGVAIFMIAFYRLAGLISIIGLAINLLFLLAAMSIFGATLTLPGLAGLALTIGMAVDANILIYERIREEVARGRSAVQAFEAGYERAFTTIVDSNITTLIIGLVLYWFGTGPVKGFAVTMSLGILTTLVSVLWCSRVFLRLLVDGGTIRDWKMGSFRLPTLDFVKPMRICLGVSTLMVVLCLFVFFSRGDKQYGTDFKGGTRMHFAFADEQTIDDVRKAISGISTVVDGKNVAKYSDAEIQIIAEAGQGLAAVSKIGNKTAREFQMRTASFDESGLRRDLQEVFKGKLSHEPFEELRDLPANDRAFGGRGQGPTGLLVHFRAEKFDLAALDKALGERLKGVLEKDEADGRPCYKLEERPAPAGAKEVLLTISRPDADAPDGRLMQVREVIRKLGKDGAVTISKDPFVSVEKIGPAVAGELRDATFWAMIWSWALMILYVAVRFNRVAYGVAAVLALVHDAIIALGFTSIVGWLVPETWGVSFEMNLNTLAAILTVIGYSVNDTIVIFDRIRENLGTMKKESFGEIINASINGTMSRTILTSFTVWLTCVILYVFTMTSGGGIASFAFPMLMGVFAGTYSTVYIAAPILMLWFKGNRPQSA